MTTTSMTMQAAITQALAEEMQRDARVLVMGEGVRHRLEDIAPRFDATRIRDTPLAEGIIAGTAVGAAASGLRPVIDLLYAPFMTLAMDELINSAGKLRYLSGGQFAFPMVALASTGAGWGVGAQHHHNLEALFAHCPGLKIAMPSNPADAKGLLKAAIRDDNPVLFFTDLALGLAHGEVPDSAEHLVPLGRAKVVREGRDLTLVSYAKTVGHCLAAAQQLGEAGISAEVIDLRSIKPLDMASVIASVRKTGRLVVVHEANRFAGIGAEIAAEVAEQCHGRLRSPVRRLGGPDAPAPAAWALEQAGVPSAGLIADTAAALLGGERVAQAVGA
ncbi:alpha-ketoacid dehydrogenase subunit beta [Caldimonas sp. KR1-144]|uniref:alpha-ketoacid dehydrogenase subunit beta n=1 Tax=Caldimonas sp. KR1-144 TaxID=3400911 RepID=UPI003C03B58B